MLHSGNKCYFCKKSFSMRTKYSRVLLKLSGESLMGAQNYGIDPMRLGQYAAQIKEAAAAGVQIAIVRGDRKSVV